MEEHCKFCKQWEEHYYWSHLRSRKIRFYQIMTGDFHRRMKLPVKFIDHYNGQLSETLQLKGPSCNVWHVNLTEVDGDVCMQSGWKEFVEAHQLKENDLLVFKYDGDCRFNVSIFEGSGCEKVFAYFVKGVNSRRHGDREDSVDIRHEDREDLVELRHEDREGSVEIIHTSSVHGVAKGDASNNPHASRHQVSPPLHPCMFPSAGQIVPNVSNKSLSTSSKMISSREASPQNKATDNPSTNKQALPGIHENVEFTLDTLYVNGRSHLTNEEEKRVMRLVHAVDPQSPFFICVMQRTHIQKRFFLAVPCEFARRHLHMKSQDIILRVPGRQRKWIIGYLVQKAASGFSAKWNTFVYDNNLEIGDICLFHMIRSRKTIEMNVHIQRNGGKASPVEAEQAFVPE